jgi:exopolysaccharide production protein ExoZ
MGIMIFHYLSWSVGKFNSEHIMGRIGVYGVSVFYILSGLTLYYVYYENMTFDTKSLWRFYKKRILRIFPLLWIVTITAILLSGKTPDYGDLLLNLTGLFGFVKWEAYFSAGVWSIGNELVFYAFFPFFVLFNKDKKYLFYLCTIILILLYIYFGYYGLVRDKDLSSQWVIYTNPLNQVFLFLSGFVLGYLLKERSFHPILLMSVFIVSILIFCFMPVHGNLIYTVTGINRIIFTFTSILLCGVVYKIDFKFPEFIHKPLVMLGEASYSVYLLHPIVWTIMGFASTYVRKNYFHYPESVNLIIAFVLTMYLSYLVYHYFEKYFMRLGQNRK